MEKELRQIRREIRRLKMEENKLILKLIKQKAKEKDTYRLPGVTKTTWKYKKPGELHRSTIYRRNLKLNK